MSYLYEQQRKTKQAFLQTLAYVQSKNEEFKELKKIGEGGEDDAKNEYIYNSRLKHIVTYLHYHNASEALIEDLQEYISELILKNRALSTELNTAKKERWEDNPIGPNEKETRRNLSIRKFQTVWEDHC